MSRVIEAEGLGKRYEIGLHTERYATLRDTLTSALRRRSGRQSSEIWALREIDLTVDQGEAVGIIGRNGAGKSTLLKLLTRITQPTTGVVRHRGRIGALLEVGTGFHPELTGRENVFLNGAILGMRKREIQAKFDEIVAFADVERFLDTPVKRYSSGMRVRLAFAVAAHLEPEILVVDEVLAVGDEAFQRKCLGKMDDVATEGRTVLLVSHNLSAIESLSQRVVWLDEGRIAGDGAAQDTISAYLDSVVDLNTARSWDDATAPGNEWVTLRGARVLAGEDGSDRLTVNTPVVLEFEYDNLKADTFLNLSLHVYNADGILVLNAVPVNEKTWFGQPFPAGRFRERCHIPANLLNDGYYRVELLVVKDKSVVLFEDSAILEFDVHDVAGREGVFEGDWAGVVRPPIAWQTEHLG